MKRCNGCHRTLPLSEFPVKKRWPDGSVRYLKSRCATCTQRDRERTAERRRRSDLAPVDLEPTVKLPAAPIVTALDHAARRRALMMGMYDLRHAKASVCRQAGIGDRLVREWRADPTALTTLDTADRILLAMGWMWWDIWAPEQFPQVAAMFDTIAHDDGQAVAA